MPVNTELVARLLQPIPGADLSGRDLRYDPRLDAIKEARREELDLPGVVNRKVADWPTVVSSVTVLLETETKDLQLAAWLTEALLQKQGVAGLATGLDVLRGLTDQFWETVHPLPEDGDLELRLGPLEWVGSRLVIAVRMAPWATSGVSYLQCLAAREIPSESDAEHDADKKTLREEAIEQGKRPPEEVDAAIEAMNKAAVRAVMADIDLAVASVSALEKTTDDRFGRDAPAFNPMRSALDEIRRFLGTQLARKLETDPDPVALEIESGSAESVAEDASGTLTVEPSNRNDAARRLGVIARWFRQQEPTSPAPYLLLRGFRWGELRAGAPDVDPKLLEAPPTATRARLKTLLLDGKWNELLEQSEVLMATSSGRGWLDLQRYVLTACGNLGGSHDAVAAAIRSELHALLRALPQLSRMTLMDDTPTANEETRAWLASDEQGDDASSGDADGEGSAQSGDVEIDDGTTVLADALDDDASAAYQGGFSRTRPARRVSVRGPDAFDVARNELAQNRPNRAIEVLMLELSRDQSPRGRFVRQTQIAYVMVESGLDAVAQPILQSLIETIDAKGLEQWESGPLVAQPMALMCRVLDRTGDESSARTGLYLRVCRLDPLQALALQSR